MSNTTQTPKPVELVEEVEIIIMGAREYFDAEEAAWVTSYPCDECGNQTYYRAAAYGSLADGTFTHRAFSLCGRCGSAMEY